MNRIRVASVSLVTALLLAPPLPAHAQAPGGGSLNLTQLAARVTALETALATEVNNRVSAVAAEINARAAADATLQSNITTEVTNRVGAVAAEINTRQAADTALQDQVDKLKGNNLTASDLEGTYNFYFIATALDPGPNTISSYVLTGSLVLGPNGTGNTSAVLASGRQLTEQTPNLPWSATGFSGVQFSGAGALWWEYSNGTVAFGTPNDPTFVTPAGNGQVMVGIQGGPPGNNQAIMLLTRQP